jgi:hypothetical protein
MTCNPFSVVTARYSEDLLTVDRINPSSFDDLLNYQNNPAFKYDSKQLEDTLNLFNGLTSTIDVSNYTSLTEKLKQGPLTNIELAEFLDNSGYSLDLFYDILQNEQDTINNTNGVVKPVIKNAISEFEIYDYPSSLEPGIYEDVKSLDNKGSSFTVIVTDKGIPVLSVVNKGSEYTPGEIFKIGDDLDISLRVKKTTDIFKPSTFRSTSGNIISKQLVRIRKSNGLEVSGLTKTSSTIVSNGVSIEVSDRIEVKSSDMLLTPGSIVSAFTLADTTITITSLTGEDVTGVLLPDQLVKIRILDSNVTQLGPIAVAPNDGTTGGSTNGTSAGNVGGFDTTNGGTTSTQQSASSEKTSPLDLLLSAVDFFLNLNYGISQALSLFKGIVLGFLQKILNLLQFVIQLPSMIKDVWNRLVEFVVSLPSILNAVKETIRSTVAGLVSNLKSQVKTLESQLGQIGSIHSLSFKQANKKMQDTIAFLADPSVERVNDLGDYFMDRMKNQFENPTPDILNWIASRMQQFVGFLQDFMNAPFKAITDTINSFKDAMNKITNFSEIRQLEAVGVGAPRIPFEDARARAIAAAEAPNRITAASPTTPGAGGGPEQNVGPSRFATIPVTQQEIDAMLSEMNNVGWGNYLSFDPGVSGSAGRIADGLYEDRNGNYFEYAPWKMIQREHPEIWIMIKRVAEKLGTKLTIISAYRSPKYNASLEGDGAAKNSLHIAAKALDVSHANVDSALFIKYASQEGFQGIAHYRTFNHVDIGARRTWNTGAGGSSAVRTSIDLHLQDRHRKG